MVPLDSKTQRRGQDVRVTSAVVPGRKDSHMLIPRQAKRQTGRWQGSPRVSLSGVRRHLVNPSELPDGHRQRLLELAQRLSRARALGDEYLRVEFSPAAAEAARHASEDGSMAPVAPVARLVAAHEPQVA